jgi:hypothetical protein
MKEKPHKYGIKIYQLCEAKSGFVCNMKVYSGAHQTDKEYNTSFGVVNRLCDPIKNRWYTVYMDRFFSSPKVLITCGVVVVVVVVYLTTLFQHLRLYSVDF